MENTPIPPGVLVVDTSPNVQSLFFTVAKGPDGGFAVILLNQGFNETVNISGLPAETYYLMRSDMNFDNQLVGTYLIEDGNLSLHIDSYKIYFLTNRNPANDQ